ncbi:MAG: hypothetical protein UW70_C0025G0009 [Candidatus Peregrinibacteria bacterium GW2011_GWA2_44_7]|nr:MAG: hypothetical protein UW70_C0025G0009 [Candidatus Peregrinibacteria bacterium GW2011_GWA2_44_7]
MDTQDLENARRLEDFTPLHDVLSTRALNGLPLARAADMVGSALTQARSGNDALVPDELNEALGQFGSQNLNVLGSLYSGPGVTPSNQLALIAADELVHRRIEEEVREQVRGQGILEMTRLLWGRYPVHRFLWQSKGGLGLREAVVAMRTRDFIEQNFQGVTDFNQLNARARGLLMEALHEAAPSHLIFGPERLKGWRDRPAQRDVRVNLGHLVGEDHLDEQDSMPLLAYLRNHREGQRYLREEYEEVVGANVQTLEVRLNGIPATPTQPLQPGLRHFFDIARRNRLIQTQQLQQEESRVNSYQSASTALKKIIESENKVLVHYFELEGACSHLSQLQNSPPVNGQQLNDAQRKIQDARIKLMAAFQATTTERQNLAFLIPSLSPALQAVLNPLLPRPALGASRGIPSQPAQLFPQNYSQFPADFVLLENHLRDLTQANGPLANAFQVEKATLDAHRQEWDEAQKPEQPFNDLSDPGSVLRNQGFTMLATLSGRYQTLSQELASAHETQRNWLQAGQFIPAPELLRRLIRRELKDPRRGPTSIQGAGIYPRLEFDSKGFKKASTPSRGGSAAIF